MVAQRLALLSRLDASALLFILLVKQAQITALFSKLTPDATACRSKVAGYRTECSGRPRIPLPAEED